VKDVRSSERLTDSAVCLVADEGDLDIRLEQMLRQHNQLQEGMGSKRILEINPSHPTIKRMATFAKQEGQAIDALKDTAFLLFDQARLLEGETIDDAAAFARRLSSVIEKGLG
jgi:molecular chaperone HtpG